MLHVLPVKHTQLYIRQDSSLGVVSGLPAGQLMKAVCFLGATRDFLFSRISILDVFKIMKCIIFLECMQPPNNERTIYCLLNNDIM